MSVSIGQGEVVGLLGHNGAGKTTIMKMLTGFLEPTAGAIRVDDAARSAATPAPSRHRIGYLPENCPVWPEMTVIDYLDYQAGTARRDRQRSGARHRAGDPAHRAARKGRPTPIETLSRGYRQRVGVAQAILHDPTSSSSTSRPTASTRRRSCTCAS